MKVIFYICILFVIMSCAHKPVNVQFCENNKCAILTEADSQEAVFLKLTAMIKANLNKKIPLMVSPEKGGKADKDIFVHLKWTASNQKYEFLPRIHSLTFTDILYIDREKREIKVIAQADTSYPAFSTRDFGSYPATSSTVQMPCSLTVRSSKEIIFRGSTKLLILAPVYLDLESLIDQIDADRLFWGSAFTIGVRLGVQYTSKDGYLHLAFQDAGQKTVETLADTKVLPAKPDIAKPELVYKVSVADKSGKGIFYGGEGINIRVEVENKGIGTARDVQVLLSGSKSLISYIGDRRFIGDIKSGDKGIAEFRTFLPVNVPAETASMHVEIIEGGGFSPKEKQIFQMAMRPSEAAKESVEVIKASQLPHLAYTAQLKDQNNNKVLDGGEEIRLRVEIKNTGEGTANNVSIELSGQKEIIDTLGSGAQIGDIKPQQKKVHEFKGVLPLQIPSGKASVRVELIEGRGFSPKEKLSLQIVMKPSEASKERVEIIAAQLPRLAYTAQLKDQNNNKVLDGGEEISLRVEIENTGEGTANNVSIELSGQKEIIDTLGSGAQIGDIKPQQKKVYEFKGVLPADIPSSTAILRIIIHEIHGRSPAKGKAVQVAMKAAETATEQVEIMSEVNVDDIPPRIKGFENKNNYAVVIGISTYRDKIIPKVKYAGRDAETMAKYLEHLAGIPKENILIKTDYDVAKSDLEEYFESWLPRRVTSDSMVYIYYAGHGTPDPAGQDAYIVPYEGHPDSPGKLYPLTKMYGALSKLPAKQVFVMLDSCFSGVEGRSVIREGTRPLVMSVENHVLTGNKIVVITGAKGNQMSSDYDKVKHGLFTYYALRGLRGEADKNGDGIVDVGELYDYVKQSVTRKASLEFNRDQTPDLLPGKADGSVLSLPIARTK